MLENLECVFFSAGIPMYIIPNTVIYDPPLLCQFIKDHAITRMLFTPSLLEAILNSPGLQLKDMFKSFKLVRIIKNKKNYRKMCFKFHTFYDVKFSVVYRYKHQGNFYI